MARHTIPEGENPRLPRGSLFKWTGPQMLRIGMTGALLVLIVVVRKPCSDSVGKLVTTFGSDTAGSAANVMPRPGNVDVPTPQHYEVITGDMTEAQIKAAMARASTAAGFGGSGSGSGSATGSGSGSATGSATGSGSGSGR